MSASLRMVCGLAVVAGCAHVTVPSAYEGPVSVQLANHTNESVCQFAMVLDGQSVTGQWLGFKKLLPGKTIDFSIKSGTYLAHAVSCGTAWTATDTKIQITGSTVIVVGGGPQTKGIPAGYTQAVIATTFHESTPTGVEQGEDDPSLPLCETTKYGRCRYK